MEKLNINSQLIIPEENKSTAVKECEAEFIYQFLSEKGFKKTLEIGLGYGRSAAYIIAATKSEHVVMDPFQDNYDKLGLKNLENLGFNQYLRFEGDYSHNFLPKLHQQGEKFDFAFIDGDHKFDGIFVDFYYVDLLLNNGGYILFHDTWMRSTQLATTFIRKNRKDYQRIRVPLRNLMLFKKAGTDERSGMFFREFYTSRRWLTFNLITWMNSGKSNLIKRILLGLKSMIVRNKK